MHIKYALFYLINISYNKYILIKIYYTKEVFIIHKEILKFIEFTKKPNHKLIETIYSKGGCYCFYTMLKHIYPQAIPYKVGLYKHSIEHIVTKINDKYYDIFGEFKLEKSEYVYISKLSEKEEEIARKYKY